jgi:hypothetical protein
MSPYFFAVLLLFIVSVVYAAERICPGHGYMGVFDNCNSSCSGDDSCPPSLKCCHHASSKLCGFHCTLPKHNVPKSGTCPPRSLHAVNHSDWHMCDGHLCDVDTDCKDNEKCCHNPCGAPICIPPA